MSVGGFGGVCVEEFGRRHDVAGGEKDPLDLESSAVFWKKPMIEEVSPEILKSEPTRTSHCRALEASAAAISARDDVDMAV